MKQQPPRSVAVIGSGFAGTAFAWTLAQAGIDVTVFEKGPDFPYPHAEPFADLVERRWRNPKFDAPADIARITTSGEYRFDINLERALAVGGAGTHWQAISLRMRPSDFRTRSLFGFGTDWPVGYHDLEAFYGHAERLIGVSGTDADNPFAPPRSTPLPLPPFELGAVERSLAQRLERSGIRLHSTPQARTRQVYDERPACQNFGVCQACPIGARYAPNHHLARAVATGRCIVRSSTSVRRILTDARGRATSLLVQRSDEQVPREERFRHIVLAGGAVETARLLLLSAGTAWPDGLGNRSGRVGRGLTFHHAWWNDLEFTEDVFGGRFGGFLGQSHQFLDPASRGRHGGLKVEFGHTPNTRVRSWGSWRDVEPQVMARRRSWPIVFIAETPADESRHIRLSDERDRFGDPFPHVHYRLLDFDHATFAHAKTVHDRFAAALGVAPTALRDDPFRFGSSAHHMGGAAMAASEAEGVTDGFGRLHGCESVYVAGSSLFPGSSGAVNPTLTIVALALRAAERLAHEARATP